MTSFVSSDCFGKGLVSGGTKGGSFDCYGLWVMGYGLWVMGYGLWVMGYG